MENSVVPSEEKEANQPANPESDKAHNQPEETGPKHVISITDHSMDEIFRELMDLPAPAEEEDKGKKPFIGQVPMLLRKKNKLKMYFRPRIMSIGPVHHGKKDLKQGQQYKLQLTKLFIEESCPYPIEILYKKILGEIESFKECYDHQELLQKFNADDQKLAWMFFVDGCALIQFVCCYLFSGLYYVNIGRDQMDLMVTDLMVLDNQLPLGVLNLVMGFSKDGGELYHNDHPDPGGNVAKKLRKFLCWFIEIIYFEADIEIDQIFNKANHLLELIWMHFVKKEKDECPPETERTSRHLRSVKDLQAAGIRLEPNHSRSSLRDISFDRGILFRKLKIPSFVVNEQRKFLLFNFIAFEMHRYFTNDRVVTSYVSFLNSLIATKEDVAELQEAGILFNHLPNDQEVVKTFRELTSSLKPYHDIFNNPREALTSYFNDKKSVRKGKWLSEARHVYFRSPWTTIAFISATFLLILTIIQTIFSVLAYQRRETICDFIPEEFNANCSKLATTLLNVSLNLRKNG